MGKDGPFNPVDRLEATDITITTPNAVFDNWDALTTPYTSVSAGTIQLTQARGMTESLALGAPAPPAFPFTASGTLGGSQNDSRVEAFTASAPVETLTAAIDCDGHCLKLHRQGAYSTDLTGNIVIKVDMSLCVPQGAKDACRRETNIQMFSVGSYKKDASWIDPDSVALTRTEQIVPSSAIPVEANVSLRYTMRHVTKGGDTYEEKDDVIDEISPPVPIERNVTLIPTRQTDVSLFALHKVSDPDKDLILRWVDPTGKDMPACFASGGEAGAFLDYLRHVDTATVARGKLEFGGGGDFKHDEAGDLEVRAKCF